MGNCQTVAQLPKQELTAEQIDKLATVIAKAIKTQYDSFPKPPRTFTYPLIRMNDGYDDADKEQRMIEWERAAEIAFHDKTYVITYDYHPGSINMRFSFVHFPDPFAPQLTPLGKPIETETLVWRTGQDIRDDYARSHSEKTEVVETKTTA